MIVDHEHQNKYIEPHRVFISSYCGQCDQLNSVHYSYGVALARKIGGHPLDYVDGGRALDDPDE